MNTKPRVTKILEEEDIKYDLRARIDTKLAAKLNYIQKEYSIRNQSDCIRRIIYDTYEELVSKKPFLEQIKEIKEHSEK